MCECVCVCVCVCVKEMSLRLSIGDFLLHFSLSLSLYTPLLPDPLSPQETEHASGKQGSW